MRSRACGCVTTCGAIFQYTNSLGSLDLFSFPLSPRSLLSLLPVSLMLYYFLLLIPLVATYVALIYLVFLSLQAGGGLVVCHLCGTIFLLLIPSWLPM